MRRTDDVSLWPWPLTLEVAAIVCHTHLGTLSEYQVQILVILRLFVFDLWATRLRLIMWLWPLTLEVMAPVTDAGHHPPSVYQLPSLKFVVLAIPKIRRTMCVGINRPGDPDLWPFDLETSVQVASKVGTLLPNLGMLGYVRDGRTKATLVGGIVTLNDP